MKEINVNLKDEIEYSHKGETVSASFVTIKPLTTKHIHLTSVLKQAFQISAMKMSEKNKESKEEIIKDDEKKETKILPSEMISMLYMGGKDIDIQEVVLTGKQLLTCGVVLVEGEEKLTSPLCDKLSQDDFEEILGSIMINFIVASLLE